MPLEELMQQRVTGINPFNELAIDAEIWRTAHNYHHTHRFIHALAAHRAGILVGLEVLAAADRTVLVAPGVAVDPDGYTMVLRDPVTLPIEPVGKSTVYVTISFRCEADSSSGVMVGSGLQYFREHESGKVDATREPKGPCVELARIYSSKADAKIADAADPADPKSNEINLLYRPIGFPHCYADIGIGELSYVASEGARWNPNHSGLWNLLREGSGRGFALRFTGEGPGADLPEQKDPPAMLYVAGAGAMMDIGTEDVDGISRFLDSGGLLFAEASGGSRDFGASFEKLAGQLKSKPARVGKGHPLLSSHYVFSSPPSGARTQGDLVADLDRGIIFSSYDYGGAWQGELDRPDAENARERIRQSQEFGLNVVAHAAQRRRGRELARFL